MFQEHVYVFDANCLTEKRKKVTGHLSIPYYRIEIYFTMTIQISELVSYYEPPINSRAGERWPTF